MKGFRCDTESITLEAYVLTEEVVRVAFSCLIYFVHSKTDSVHCLINEVGGGKSGNRAFRQKGIRRLLFLSGNL
jgi:hypothetical protein